MSIMSSVMTLCDSLAMARTKTPRAGCDFTVQIMKMTVLVAIKSIHLFFAGAAYHRVIISVSYQCRVGLIFLFFTGFDQCKKKNSNKDCNKKGSDTEAATVPSMNANQTRLSLQINPISYSSTRCSQLGIAWIQRHYAINYR